MRRSGSVRNTAFMRQGRVLSCISPFPLNHGGCVLPAPMVLCRWFLGAAPARTRSGSGNNLSLWHLRHGFRFFNAFGGRGGAAPPTVYTAIAPPQPLGRLPAVPLIGDKGYYGEAPERPRRGSQEGRMPGWRRTGGRQARLLSAK